ncbi:MAG: NADH-quinone oxidoreductase subunit [Alphaproteobacteria bacterium]|nr:NADH-quinone oxidoreductase subunit [Alphaproteobacteria bacterium]
MNHWPLISFLVFLPILGIVCLALHPMKSDCQLRFAKYFTLGLTVVNFAASLFLLKDFDTAQTGFQFVENAPWWPSLGLNYHVGIDGISLWLVLLSTFLMPICIACSWDSIQHRLKEYLMAFLLLETMMIGAFVSLDTILFYVFFEGLLIPMFILIGVWGGPRRVYASFKFFLYTLLGSVLMLVALIALYLQTKTTDITVLMNADIPGNIQLWLWWAFFISFAVKMPMWPVHTWLPDAHVEAPTAGSVILAGVLLKMGGYGFLRFSLPMLPDASIQYAPIVMALSVIAIIYTSLVALAQTDMKKMIAYSSVAHMGYVTLGLFSFNQQGIDGAMFQMLSHGIVSAALFLCVGVVYDRLHTRDLGRYGGLVNNMPRYAVVFMLFTLASVGLPGTGGFVGEFLSLLGAFRANTMYATLATSGLILGACYMLWLYRKVIFGVLDKDDVKAMTDLSWREILIFVPLVILVFWMGIYPTTFLKPMQPAIHQVIARLAP